MRLFANNATSTLASGVSDSDNTLLLATGEGARFPAPTAGDHFDLTLTQGIGLEESWEIVKVTARSGDTLTVTRGQEGTAAAAWAAGAKAELRLTKEAMEELTAGSSIAVLTYDNRATLRSTPAIAGKQSIVDGLGLFVHHVGSDEPDDDESCFATATGRWLLECPHWDVIDAWQRPDSHAERFAEDFAAAFPDAFGEAIENGGLAPIINGTATCAITSVASASSASFVGTVTGAAVGDRVIATPPAQLGSDAANTGRLSYHAWVSAADTVTVMLTNASAASATTNAAVRAAWPITVIKGS